MTNSRQNHGSERSHSWESLLTELGVREPGVQAPGDRLPKSGLRITRLEMCAGRMTSVVVDKETGQCDVSIEMPEWQDEQWASAIELLSQQALFVAQMLAGAFPDELEPTLKAGGLALLPTPDETVSASCSCCEISGARISEKHCRHIAAVLQNAGEMISDDPWLLFLLRGRMRQQVLRALRRSRGQNGNSNGAAQTGRTPQIVQENRSVHQLHGLPSVEELNADRRPLADEALNFWGSSRAQEQFRPHIVPPVAELVLLRRLGPPAFSHANAEVYDTFSEIYQRVTEAALALAYAEDPPIEASDPESAEQE